MEKDNAKRSAERLESRKSHSWWWETHINPKNAKWISENVEEMDHSIERMLKLIDDDGDSLVKKAEMYFKKRPELISAVQEFQRMYQSLAERYVQLTGDLKRNVASDQHSPGSGLSDSGFEPPSPWISPDMRTTRFRPSHRAAGFDVFLGSGGSTNDRSLRGDELSSVSGLSDSEESDISSVHSYALHDYDMGMQNGNGLLKRTESVSLLELQSKISSYEEEIANLKMELQNVQSDNKLATEEPEISNDSTETDASDPDQKTQALVNDLRTAKGRLFDLEKQVVRLSTENKLAHETIRLLQDQFKAAQKDAAVFKAKLESEMRKSSKWQDRIARHKASLIDRDVEIRELKDLVSDASKKYQLHAEISRLTDEKGRVEEKARELEVRCHTLESQLELVENKLKEEIEELKMGLSEKGNQLEALKLRCECLVGEKDELGAKVAELIPEAELGNQLKVKVEELKEEVEAQRELISEGAELKREAIRQLCFSLEHYRNGYEKLRKAVRGPKRVAVCAS